MGLFDRSNSRASKRKLAPPLQDARSPLKTIVQRPLPEFQRQPTYNPWRHYASATTSPTLERSDPFIERTVRPSPSMQSLQSVRSTITEKRRTSRIPRSSSDTIRPIVSDEGSPTKHTRYEKFLRMRSSSSLSIFPRTSTPLPPLSESNIPDGRMSIDQAGRVLNAGQEKLARHIRESGHRLKHSASKLSLISNFSNLSDVEEKPRIALRSPCRVHGQRNCSCARNIACSITSPQEFKHVTHAERQHFKNLATRSQNDLVADYSVMRARQRPSQDLNGIRAEEIPASSRCSLDAGSTLQTTPTRHGYLDAALPSPVPSLISANSADSLSSSQPSASTSRENLNSARSTYNFSRHLPELRSPRTPVQLRQRPSCESISTNSSAYYERLGKLSIRKISSTPSNHSDTDSMYTVSEPPTPGDDTPCLSPLDKFSYHFAQALDSSLPSVVEDDDTFAGPGTPTATTPPPFIESYRTKKLPAVPSIERLHNVQQAKPVRITRIPVSPPRQLRHTGSLPKEQTMRTSVARKLYTGMLAGESDDEQ